jgi:hypothetical protein
MSSSTIKSVAYSFCGGFPQPYAFDAVVIEAGKMVLDVHKKFKTREEFFEEVERVIPMFDGENDESRA